MKNKLKISHIGWILGLSLLGISQFQGVSYAISNHDGTHYDWTDPDLSSGTVPIRAIHLTDIIWAIDNAITPKCMGLTQLAVWGPPTGPGAFTGHGDGTVDGITVGTPVRSAQILALRSAIKNLYAAKSATPIAGNSVWAEVGTTDDASAGTIIRRNHLQDMRDALDSFVASPSCTTGAVGFCGDGVTDLAVGETCDNGTTGNGACPFPCSATCQTNTCYQCSGTSCVATSGGTFSENTCGGTCAVSSTACWVPELPCDLEDIMNPICSASSAGCPSGGPFSGQTCNNPGASCRITTCLGPSTSLSRWTKYCYWNCTANACAAPVGTCTDGSQNQDETGIDCGGATCPACISGCWQSIFFDPDAGGCAGPAPPGLLCPAAPSGKPCTTVAGLECIVNTCQPSGMWSTRTFSCDPSACAAPNLDVCRFTASASWASHTGEPCSPDGPRISCDCSGANPYENFLAQCTGGVGTYTIGGGNGVCP